MLPSDKLLIIIISNKQLYPSIYVDNPNLIRILSVTQFASTLLADHLDPSFLRLRHASISLSRPERVRPGQHVGQRLQEDHTEEDSSIYTFNLPFKCVSLFLPFKEEILLIYNLANFSFHSIYRKKKISEVYFFQT